MATIAQFKPDYLFVVATAAAADSAYERVREGYREVVNHAVDLGVTVVGVRDNLRSESNLFDCERDPDPLRPWSGCEYSRAKHFPDSVGEVDVARRKRGYVFVDMTDAFCVQDVCPSVIGNVAVYMDNNHVTRDYAASLSPFFMRRVEKELTLDAVSAR